MKKDIREKRVKSKLTKASEIIPLVKENLALDKSLNIMALREIWPLVTNFETAKYSQPAYFDKDGNLVISVRSGALSVELSMQKTKIIGKLKDATKNTEIRFKDIRFINRT